MKKLILLVFLMTSVQAQAGIFGCSPERAAAMKSVLEKGGIYKATENNVERWFSWDEEALEEAMEEVYFDQLNKNRRITGTTLHRICKMWVYRGTTERVNKGDGDYSNNSAAGNNGGNPGGDDSDDDDDGSTGAPAGNPGAGPGTGPGTNPDDDDANF